MSDFFIWSASVVFAFFALVFAILLARETKHERYWIFLVIAAFAFLVYLIATPDLFSDTLTLWIHQGALPIALFALMYALFGLWHSMKKIREKIGEELH